MLGQGRKRWTKIKAVLNLRLVYSLKKRQETNPYDEDLALCRRFIRILIVTSRSEKTLEAEAPLFKAAQRWFVSIKALNPPKCRGCFRVAISIYVHDVLWQLFDSWEAVSALKAVIIPARNPFEWI